MKIDSVYIGGWYQRTTLHLSEIYDWLQTAGSPLALDKKRLQSLRAGLETKTAEMRIREFEYIYFQTNSGTTVHIFEDGLIVLSRPVKKIKDDIKSLTRFYEEKLSPALNYLFSLGAPVPKELASIATVYPYFILLQKATPADIAKLMKELGERQQFAIKRPEFEIYRGGKIYLINNFRLPPRLITRLINEQIFAREFKIQLHHYLNLHRTIWEKIAAIKERGEIAGREAGPLRTQIESYSKTVNLIASRINQMNTYLGTREKVVQSDAALEKIIPVLQFKYETLNDSLAYVKEIWLMTKNYLDSSLTLFAGIQAKSTEASLKNLAVITVTGVAASLIRVFSGDMPRFTANGLLFALLVVFAGFAADEIIKLLSRRKKYKIKEAPLSKDFK